MMEESREYFYSNLVFLCVNDVDDYNPQTNNFICGVFNENHTKIMDINTGKIYDCSVETITKKVIKPNYHFMNLASRSDYYIEKPVSVYKINVDGKIYSSFNIRAREESLNRYTYILENGIFSDDKLKMSLFSVCNLDLSKEISKDKINFFLDRMQLATTKNYNNFKGIKIPTNTRSKRV